MKSKISLVIALVGGLVLISLGCTHAQEIPTPEGIGLGYAIYAGAVFRSIHS